MGKQKRKKLTGIVIALLLMLCVTATAAVPMKAAAEQQENRQVMRVVVPEQHTPGYFQGENGEYTGYFVEYLEDIAQYTGWQYEYSVVDDSDELLEITKSHDFDLMVGVPYTLYDSTMYFEYPEHSLGHSELVLATRKDNTKVDADDLTSLRGLRVGISLSEENQKLEERFKSFCFTNGIDYVDDRESEFSQGINFIHVPDEERIPRLMNKEYDAIITTDNIALENNLYAVTTFGRNSLYAVFPKGEKEQLESLNKAIESIGNQDLEYESRLYDKYFSSNFQSQLTFEVNEQQYMEEVHTYKVGIYDNCAPYGYLNDDGIWCGVTVAVFRDIENKTNQKLKFEFVGYPNVDAMTNAVKAGECDIMGLTFSSMQLAKAVGGTQSRIYYDDTFHLYSNYENFSSLEELQIALKTNFPQDMWQSAGFLEENLTRTDNVEEALVMVDTGKADATIALQKVADYYINYDQLGNLNKMSIDMSPVSFCAVYGAHVDKAAVNIMERCMAYLDRGMLNRQIMEYILMDHKDFTIMDYINRHQSLVAWMVILGLSVVITFLVVIIFTITKKTRRINRMLNYDDITEGISYMRFHEEAENLILEKGEPVYFLYVDISNFKYINDAYEYSNGNQVLCVVYKFLKDMVGEFPCARVYADHFVTMNHYKDNEAAVSEIEDHFHKFRHYCRDNFPDFNVFLKMGIYVWDGKEALDIEKAVNLANYAAASLNNISRNELAFYTEEMHNNVLMQQEIEKDMHRAMDDGEFIAFYQPKVDIETGQIMGAEALVRWKHKDKGLISPGKFIPIFEKNRFIIELDFCIFEQVCAFQAQRMAEGKELCPISCNFSRLHLTQNKFVNRMVQIVEKYQVPPQYLEIEITETIATDDFDIFIDKIKELKENGFRISIDDFGNGYSCIQLLYKMPIDVLKFDRVFVTTQDRSKIEQAVNRSIINICHENHIIIVCEGVETIQQQDFVRSYGCHYVQGFLYSKPVDELCFLKMLEQRILVSQQN